MGSAVRHLISSLAAKRSRGVLSERRASRQPQAIANFHVEGRAITEGAQLQ
jgi:hypothetical protein